MRKGSALSGSQQHYGVTEVSVSPVLHLQSRHPAFPFYLVPFFSQLLLPSHLPCPDSVVRHLLPIHCNTMLIALPFPFPSGPSPHGYDS